LKFNIARVSGIAGIQASVAVLTKDAVFIPEVYSGKRIATGAERRYVKTNKISDARSSLNVLEMGSVFHCIHRAYRSMVGGRITMLTPNQNLNQ
jgi:hypothetical protein